MKKLVWALFAAAALFAADVTGTWDVTVEVGGNTGGPTFVLKQTGSAVSGKYSGALGESDVTGKVDGDKLEMSFTVSPQGEKVEVFYKGTVKADGTMSGKLEIPGLGEGTFKGTKRK